MQAAVAGAGSVCCIDSSEAALDGALRNAALNGVDGSVRVAPGRADAVMQALARMFAPVDSAADSAAAPAG